MTAASVNGEAKITALIPCYNAEKYLAEAIESVQAQTRPVSEILIVDDGSTDGSVAVAERYPVKVLRLEKNSGHAAARNVGIQAAQGDLIAWLDADDYWDSDHLERVCKLLDRFPSAAVGYSAFRFVGEKAGERYFPCEGEPQHQFWDHLRNTRVQPSAAVTRRGEMLESGGFDESIRVAPDFEFWLRLSRTCKFISSPKVTVNYRFHSKQITSQFPREQWASIYRSRMALLEKTRAEGDAELMNELERAMLEIWEGDVRKSVRTRNAELLGFYLGLVEFVPGSSLKARRIRRWSKLPFGLLERYLDLAPRVSNRLRRLASYLDQGSSE